MKSERIKNFLITKLLPKLKTFNYVSNSSHEMFFYRTLEWKLTRFPCRTIDKIQYYEFGTGWGYTLTAFLRAASAIQDRYKLQEGWLELQLFDSFEGLPEEKDEKDFHPEWGKNVYAFDVNYIKRKINSTGFNEKIANFHKGYFEHTLTKTKKEIFITAGNQPDIVTIDCDYYSSSAEVLVFLRELLRPETILYFDDLWSFNGDPKRGQLCALNEEIETGAKLRKFPLNGDLGSRVFISY